MIVYAWVAAWIVVVSTVLLLFQYDNTKNME